LSFFRKIWEACMFSGLKMAKKISQEEEARALPAGAEPISRRRWTKNSLVDDRCSRPGRRWMSSALDSRLGTGITGAGEEMREKRGRWETMNREEVVDIGRESRAGE
jgi:hypothetical protein